MSTLSIWSTRRRIACVLNWIFFFYNLVMCQFMHRKCICSNSITCNNWSFVTSSKWISDQSVDACANRSMIGYMTFSSNAAYTNTRITTLFIHTSLIVRAIRIDWTLGSAIWWGSEVISKARTWRNVSIWLTLTIWTTRRRKTGIWWLKRVFYRF